MRYICILYYKNKYKYIYVITYIYVMFREYSQSSLLDRMLRLHFFQHSPEDYFMTVLIFNTTTHKIGCSEYW